MLYCKYLGIVVSKQALKRLKLFYSNEINIERTYFTIDLSIHDPSVHWLNIQGQKSKAHWSGEMDIGVVVVVGGGGGGGVHTVLTTKEE